MKDKKKLAIIAILAVLLIVGAILISRMVGQLLIGSVDQIQAAGEAPLPTEGVWIAPTLAPDEDFAQQEAEALETMPDPSATPAAEEEPGSVPILESPEQLAGTADHSAIIDENPGDD